MNIAAARSFFPGTQGRIFLDAACVSLLPLQAEAAMRRLGSDLLACSARDASAHHIALDATAEPTRREAARLVAAQPEDIALIESTTQGLAAIAAAVPLGPGDKILIGETEFLGLAVPWIGRQERQGFRIETVPHRAGRLLADDFASALDRHTRMILLSSVQWSNGYRVDLAAFSRLARQENVILVVDAIQQLGAFGLDVRQTPVDFLVAGGHKWLNAPVGRGFLYADPYRTSSLPPPAWGYLNIVEPPEGWAAYFGTPTIPAVGRYDFIRSARRFEIGGTANYPGNVALGASLALINDLGLPAIEEHIVRLTDRLIGGLHRAGLTVVSPLEREARSGIITITRGEGPDADRACLEQLLTRGILISQRYTAGVGGLRVSIHFFNNEEDVDRLLEAVAKAA
jgi:selenocysteine lyase/cysteine desulfurase